MNDEAKALLICGAMLFGAGNGSGFVGGRMSAPVPPVEVRFVQIPAPAPLAPAMAMPIEPPAIPPEALSPVPLAKPQPAPAAPPEATPLPQPRPKVEARPKPRAERDSVAKRPRLPTVRKSQLPSCAHVKREYEAMTWPQRMDAYRKASPEEIAHGKRCLGF